MHTVTIALFIAVSSYLTSPSLASHWEYVVTLGDSYASGTGIHNRGDEYDEEYGGINYYNGETYVLTSRDDTECWREKDDTPGAVYASNNANSYPGGSLMYACKGAEVSHVERQLDLLNDHYTNEAAVQWDGSVILLTAGGNDIRTVRGDDWPDLLERCILWQSSCESKSDNQVANWATIESRLKGLMLQVLVRAAKARAIRIMGYPEMMQPKSSGWNRCPDVTGIDRHEANWIDSQVHVLNSKLVSAIAYAKTNFATTFAAEFPGQTIPQIPDIQYVSVYNYLTIGACTGTPSTRHVNDKVLVDVVLTSDASFHPSAVGYDRMYDALHDSIN